MTRGTDRYIVVHWEERYGGWSVTRGMANVGPRGWRRRIATGVRVKELAIAGATRIAKQEHLELLIKTKAGRIADRRSYGRDPKHRPG